MRSFAFALVSLFFSASVVPAQTDFYVGSNSSFVTTTFDSGVSVFSNVYVGFEPGADDNTLVVTNAGTSFECVNGSFAGNTFVGRQGKRNGLFIAGGANFKANVYAGYDTNSSGNWITIAGSNTALTGDVILGYGYSEGGSSNSLVVSNGAQLIGAAGCYSAGNSILVDGINSLLQGVYFASSNNNITVSNGAKISGNVIGNFAGSGNVITLTGTDSMLTNANKGSPNILTISGDNTRIFIRDGAVASLSGSNSYVSLDSMSTAGAVELLIEGQGSLLQSFGNLSVVNFGTGGQSICFVGITNGGKLLTQTVRCGDFRDSNSIGMTSVKVSGSGSIWSNSSHIALFTAAELLVESGAELRSREILVAGYGRASQLTVNGLNTMCEAGVVGVYDGSTLTLRNGAVLSVTMPRPVGRTYISLSRDGALDFGLYNGSDASGAVIASLIELYNGGKVRFNHTNSLTIDADIGGLSPGNPYSSGSIEQLGTGTTTLNGSNSFVGLTQVNAGQLILGDAGRFQFVIGPDGASNRLTGSGSFTANGKFGFDLSQAPRRTGDSWQIVSVGSANYGTNFSVDGFVNSGQETWDRLTNQTLYRFNQTTGTLSVVSGSTSIPYNRWVTNFPSLVNMSVAADPDRDGYSNQQEFAFNGIPVDPTASMLQIESTGSNAKISFMGRRNTNEAAYYVMSTTNLSSGTWQTNSSVSLIESADQSDVVFPDAYVRREFTVPASGRSFFRIKAEVPQ